MSDFDLADALESPEELKDEGFSSCRVDSEMSLSCNVQKVQDKIFNLHEGLDLVVSHNRLTMQCIANLYLVVKRVKRSLNCCGTARDDHELCNVLVDTLLTETVTKTTESFSTGEARRKFERCDSDNLCTLCDISQKDIVQVSGQLELQAITLKGGHSEGKVNFKLSRYITDRVPAGAGQTVTLSITNSKLHLSSSMKDGRAVLNLEECREEDLRIISADGNMDRFLFYKRTTGICHTTFESVRCRGWFISTSFEAENQPVEMCEADASRRLKSFRVV